MQDPNIRKTLTSIYGTKTGEATYDRLTSLMESFDSSSTSSISVDEKTVVAIAYGDHLQSREATPIASLHSFMKREFAGLVNHVHILPFYPYSSDDGFSVIDYTAVDPKLGSWSDIRELGEDYGLMFDLVLNHVSSESEWFKAFLKDDPKYSDFFIVVAPTTDLSSIRRPRTSPLLTPFETPSGTKHVWTTFSSDQVDLKFANPEVLLAMIEVLFKYISEGAQLIRLDAITYLWKEIKSDGVHHENTHLIAQLIRSVVKRVAPHVGIITETNVPHDENISYFGDGHNEAHGVYNFALPPLLVHTIHQADKRAFDKWAKSLTVPSENTFFFNFTSSHDGIGVTPVKGLLGQDEVNNLVERVQEHGGKVNFKSTESGESEPYELNTTFYDALSHPEDGRKVSDARFMVSQAIMLALKGVPGIYFGNLVGTKNWYEGVERLGHNRAINRRKLELGKDIDFENISDPSTERGGIVHSYRSLLNARTTDSAFSPSSSMEVLDLNPGTIALYRQSIDSEVLAIHSITSDEVHISLEGSYKDILTGKVFEGKATVQPYGIYWLKPVRE